VPRLLAALAVSATILLAGPQAALADPLDDIIRDLIHQPLEDGDHVVGEEMC
jgi:hypothetical protein